MFLEDPISSQFNGIPASHHVDQDPAVAQPVKGGRHSRGQSRRDQTGTEGHQESHPPGLTDQRGSSYPGILARTTSRQKSPIIPERIDSHRDLTQIVKVEWSSPSRGA